LFLIATDHKQRILSLFHSSLIALSLLRIIIFSRSLANQKLTDCSFMFDADLGVGAGFGLDVGVTSTKCVNKFMTTLGWAVGGGIGFNGCNTFKLADIAFG
jgi:hypothetical protein